MASTIGAFAAQEVLKACSGKFNPLQQSLYFDSLESLPSTTPTGEECAPQNSRYDGQIAVFGKTFQKKIQSYREFLVGSGAIGCEMLKNWACMGLGTSDDGVIYITDLDTIEKSNLNRQFLFRPKDLGKFKAEAAAQAVAEMNPELAGRIKTYQLRVGEDTESKCTETTRSFVSHFALRLMSESCRYIWRRVLRTYRLRHQRLGQCNGPSVHGQAMCLLREALA